jgi:hypothetical protein
VPKSGAGASLDEHHLLRTPVEIRDARRKCSAAVFCFITSIRCGASVVASNDRKRHLRPPRGSVLVLDERPGSAPFDAPGGPPLRNIVQLSVAVLIRENQVRANQEATVTKLFAQQLKYRQLRGKSVKEDQVVISGKLAHHRHKVAVMNPHAIG